MRAERGHTAFVSFDRGGDVETGTLTLTALHSRHERATLILAR